MASRNRALVTCRLCHQKRLINTDQVAVWRCCSVTWETTIEAGRIESRILIS